MAWDAPVRRLLCLLTLLAALYPSGASTNVMWRIGAGPGAATCTWTGSVMGSCLPSSDTTDLVLAPRGGSPGVSDSYGFNSGTANSVSNNGQSVQGGCDAVISTTGASGSCDITTQLKVCATPGNISSNTHPWADEGVVSWQASGTVSYRPRANDPGYGLFVSGVPAFSPGITFENTSGSRGILNFLPVSYMQGGVCGTNMNSGFFVDAIRGNMPNLRTATAGMGSNDTLTVTQPGSFPFLPAAENHVGPVAGTANPPSNLTVSLSGVSIGYSFPNDKGTFDVGNNGTTITGGTVFWVNPSNNQACIAYDAGLDLTVTGFRCEMAEMGLVRANVRIGTVTLTDDIFENIGCQDDQCAFGHNHPIYLGTVTSSGFDTVLATNVSDPDVQEIGWNLKLRPSNSVVTQSFFGPRINNGASGSHGSIDYPCSGTHSVTFSAFGVNQYSFDTAISSQASDFLVQAGEENSTNTVTATGNVQGGVNCPTTVLPPNAAGFTATITGPNTFTTPTNPTTFVPIITFTGPNTAGVWDLNASGLMENGAAQVVSWSGPTAGVYTVQLNCFDGEGTIPLTSGGLPIYSCFSSSSGTATMYATGAVVPLLSNTPTTASISVPIDPAQFGFVVGDTMIDPSNTLSITSITGSGPFTINMSCAHPSFAGGSNCIFPSINMVEVPIASGTYNTSTGAVSLVLGADVGLTTGSSVTLQGLFGTGAVSSLNGTYTATSGTTGTTLNYTAATGLGAITIGSSGNINGGAGLTSVVNNRLPAGLYAQTKNGPVQLIASTSGTGCDGTNTLCGIASRPDGMFITHGKTVAGTDVGTSCVTAGQIISIQPQGGATGSGFTSGDIGKSITLVGGTFETAAVVTIATVSSGQITSVTMASSGVYTAFAKTFTQGTTTAGGTGAQFQFPYPAIIQGGSPGAYTLRLAQASGANCITGSTTNQTYQTLTPTKLTYDHDLIGWDGGCPNGGPCTILAVDTTKAWESATISNSILWSNVATGGPFWGAGTGSLSLGGTDGGGNIECSNRTDTGTNARCAIPPFTAASFTAALAGTALTVGCGTACMTISSGTYNSSTGVVTLTVSASGALPYGGVTVDAGSGQCAFSVSGLTGTGSLSGLNGNWFCNSSTTGTTLTFTGPTGLGSVTITGGNVNPASGASVCKPGMYVWDNQGLYSSGTQGVTIGGTRIVSGSAPNFVVSIPPGGAVTTDIPSKVISCGWGMPSSQFSGSINSSGVLTISTSGIGIVGSIHVGDYIVDNGVSPNNGLPANVQVTSGSGTTWQTTYSGAGVSAEQMVSVR